MRVLILLIAAMFSVNTTAQDSLADLKFGTNKEACEENLSIYTSLAWSAKKISKPFVVNGWSNSLSKSA